MNFFRQQGYLAMVAVFLIVIIGFLGLSVTYMVTGGANTVNNFANGNNALYLAGGGLEKATRYLSTPLLSGSAARISCGALSGNTNLTASAFGDGTFTVTTVAGSPFYANTTLSSAITASSTSLSVASVTGLSSSGRVMIDNEAINYAAISGTTLLGLIRGANGTIAASHTSGTQVGQYLCLLQSAGGIPSFTSPTWKRTVQQGVSLQHGWAVGNLSGSSFILTEWNQATELAWNNSTLASTAANVATLNAISMLPNGEAWAAGNVDSGHTNFVFMHLTGDIWSEVKVAGAVSGQNLLGVSTVSATEAWAVGVLTGSSSNKKYTVLKWNGSSWSILSSPSIPANSSSTQNLNAVSVIDTTGNGTGDIGFAVGAAGRILKYNGSTWSVDTSPTAQNLNDVVTVSASEAWAVGAAGVIIKWNGTSWSSATSPTSTQLNGIAMLDTSGNGTANVGIAVGNGGVVVGYNGTTWSTQTMCDGNAYQSVTMPNSSDAWAVGASGHACHWNGSSWTLISSGVAIQLNSISIPYMGKKPFSALQEIFA